MYDLHSHILPGIDDGAPDLATALQMARMATADGVTHMACTPHIYPELYPNNSDLIQSALDNFRGQLAEHDIHLVLGAGADIQMVPEMLTRLEDGTMPTINNSRYLLFEPPHHVKPFNFEESVRDIKSAGYVPIITHPERLTWAEECYDQFVNVVAGGAWLQLTAGSLTGNFGPHAGKLAIRFLKDGIVHLLASDTHNTDNRSPVMSAGMKVAERHLGAGEARALVYDRPQAVWNNIAPENIPGPPAFNTSGEFTGIRKRSMFSGLLRR